MKKIICGVFALCLLLGLTGCSAQQGQTSTGDTAAANQETVESTADSVPESSEETSTESTEASSEAVSGLAIPLSELTDAPQFYDWDSNGTAMQVIALKDSNGDVQLAYNTCQVCAGSPYAYFEISNGRLICQNCGNAFSYSAVGKVAGGCNPMPVSSYDVTADSIVIDEATLAQIAPAFANWKGLE